MREHRGVFVMLTWGLLLLAALVVAVAIYRAIRNDAGGGKFG